MLGSRLVLALAVGVAAAAAAQAQSLDFATYKSRVEPVFYKKRPGHARCVACHSAANNSFRQQPLAEGASYTEEQSRKNFDVVAKLVIPGDPEKSVLVVPPLAQGGGRDEFHSGGPQFRNKADPDWKTIADWIAQAKSK